MERAFIIKPSCELFSEVRKYNVDSEKQRLFVKNFEEKHGIQSTKYIVSGNGRVNVPFPDEDIGDIHLGIIPTEEDREKLGSQLKKAGNYGVCRFKKSSPILKEFAHKCVDEAIVINLYRPSLYLRDYFKSIGLNRLSTRLFMYNDKLYSSIESEFLDKNELPDGFEEMKMSDFYKVIEEIEEANNETDT